MESEQAAILDEQSWYEDQDEERRIALQDVVKRQER